MKKILSVFLLISMLSLLLVGCTVSGGESNNQQNNSNSGVEQNTDESNNQNQEGTENNTPDASEKEDQNEANKEEQDENNENHIPSDPKLPEIGTAVGDRFNDLTLQTVDGETVNTADYRGKIIVINIWATWCPPCKAELPDFSRVAFEYSDDVVIIAAHVPRGSANAKSYIETNLPGSEIIFAYDTIYSDAFIAAGGYEYIPQTAIIDANGIIIYSDSGAISYDTLISLIEMAK